MHRSARRRPGFTFVELLIVTGIIAFLAAIAVPTGCGGRTRANVRACEMNRKTMAGAIEMYALDFAEVPEVLDAALLQKLVENGYLTSVPRDPGNAQDAPEDAYFMTKGPNPWVGCRNHHGDDDLGWAPWGELQDGTLAARLEEVRGPAARRWLAQRLKEGARAARRDALREGFLYGGVSAGTVAALLLAFGLVRRARRVAPEVVHRRPTLDREVRVIGAGARWFAPRTRGPTPAGARVVPNLADARCPVCACGFDPGKDLVVPCHDCGTPHHEDCGQFNRSCGIYGCPGDLDLARSLASW